MTTVNNASAVGAGVNQATVSAAQELSDQFLTLLTAQLQNQDPLNPMDNAELTSQMAQISTVTGISQLNTTMEWLSYNMSSLQSTQAASLLGRQAMVGGDLISLDQGQAEGAYQLSASATKAEVIVTNSSGAEVDRFSVNDLAPGVHTFNWDGKGGALPDGKYSFRVEALVDGNTVQASTLSIFNVAGVRPYAGGTVILDQHGNSVDLNNVYQIS